MKQEYVDEINVMITRIQCRILATDSPMERMSALERLDGMTMVLSKVDTIAIYYDESLGVNQVKKIEDEQLTKTIILSRSIHDSN